MCDYALKIVLSQATQTNQVKSLVDCSKIIPWWNKLSELAIFVMKFIVQTNIWEEQRCTKIIK